jgi:hypothetical protein
MKYFLFTLAWIASLSFGIATQTSAQAKLDKTLDAWDVLLKKYVTPGGVVDYAGFKADKEFSKVLAGFNAVAPETSWTKDQEMAYWINVYNAYTVKLIVDRFPLKSINDIEKPWEQPIVKAGGKTYTLNAVEHEILRPKFKDPRVHFAINCASFSCPVLPNKAIRASTLQADLDKLTRDFLNDIHRNRISSRKAEISQIFEWFADDFKAAGGVRKFIADYRGVALPESTPLSYITYDWKLNGKP